MTGCLAFGALNSDIPTLVGGMEGSVPLAITAIGLGLLCWGLFAIVTGRNGPTISGMSASSDTSKRVSKAEVRWTGSALACLGVALLTAAFILTGANSPIVWVVGLVIVLAGTGSVWLALKVRRSPRGSP